MTKKIVYLRSEIIDLEPSLKKRGIIAFQRPTDSQSAALKQWVSEMPNGLRAKVSVTFGNPLCSKRVFQAQRNRLTSSMGG